MKTLESRSLKEGRFTSHREGAKVYYDSRHKVLTVPVEGGMTFELVLERQSDGSYQNRFLTSHGPDGNATVLNYSIPS